LPFDVGDGTGVETPHALPLPLLLPPSPPEPPEPLALPPEPPPLDDDPPLPLEPPPDELPELAEPLDPASEPGDAVCVDDVPHAAPVAMPSGARPKTRREILFMRSSSPTA
jgi:hypothetical protein